MRKRLDRLTHVMTFGRVRGHSVCVCVGILNYNGLHLFQSAGETNTQGSQVLGSLPPLRVVSAEEGA